MPDENPDEVGLDHDYPDDLFTDEALDAARKPDDDEDAK